MLTVTKTKGICKLCTKPATIAVNGFHLCSACGDKELIKIIGIAAKAVKYAKVGLSIKPIIPRR
jgi:hypothetical protein